MLVTYPPITPVSMVDCYVYLILLAMLIIVFMKTKEKIVGVMVQDVEVGTNRSATLIFTIMEKMLMVMEEVDLSFIPAPLPPIIRVFLVYHCVSIVVVMRVLYIGIKSTK